MNLGGACPVITSANAPFSPDVARMMTGQVSLSAETTV